MGKLYAGSLPRQRASAVVALHAQVGGCKAGSAAVTGAGVYGRLKFEAGIHRVQRVPVTEKGGRVHTSAAAVAVLPQADEVIPGHQACRGAATPQLAGIHADMQDTGQLHHCIRVRDA